MTPEANKNDTKVLMRLLARQQVISIGVVVAVILQAFVLLRHQPKTILEPPSRSRAISVQGDRVDSDYMIDMAQYVAHMMLDVTPKVIDSRQDEILRWVHPATYGDLQNRMTVAAKRLKEGNATTIFWATQVAPDPDNLRVAVIGSLETYINGTKVPPDRAQSWLLQFESKGGRMLIKDWKETPLDDPLLAKVLAAQTTKTGAKNGQN